MINLFPALGNNGYLLQAVIVLVLLLAFIAGYVNSLKSKDDDEPMEGQVESLEEYLKNHKE